MSISPISDPVLRERAVLWDRGWRPWWFYAAVLGALILLGGWIIGGFAAVDHFFPVASARRCP